MSSEPESVSDSIAPVELSIFVLARPPVQEYKTILLASRLPVSMAEYSIVNRSIFPLSSVSSRMSFWASVGIIDPEFWITGGIDDTEPEEIDGPVDEIFEDGSVLPV